MAVIRRVEMRVEAMRLPLRKAGFAQPEDTLDAIRWMGKCLEVRPVLAEVASLARRPGTSALIMVPRYLAGARLSEAILEELAHYLLDTGLGGFLRAHARTYASSRLAQTVERTEESHARAFLEAWHLPSSLLARYRDDAEVSILSRCPLEMIRKRRRELAGAVFRVTREDPPVWSAARYYSAYSRGGAASLVEVVPPAARSAEFLLPAEPGCADELARQVGDDAIALTVDEFRIKYREYRAAPRVCVRAALPLRPANSAVLSA